MKDSDSHTSAESTDVSQEEASADGRFSVSVSMLLIIVAGLTLFGLVILSSAGKMTPQISGLRGESIFQLKWLGFALAAGAIAYFLNFEEIRRLRLWRLSPILLFYLLTLVVLAWLFFKGVATKGSARWLDFFGLFKIQVSEPAKIALLFMLADYLSANGTRRLLSRRGKFRIPAPFRLRKTFPWIRLNPDAGWEFFAYGFLVPAAILAAPCLFIGIAPDMGTMALCGMVGAAMLFAGGVGIRYLLPTLAAAVSAFALVIYHWPARMNRVISFLDPVEMGTKEGFQLLHGLLGIAEGGLAGKGLGNGVQQRYFTPEPQTDFIFAAIGEECGLCATVGVVVAFFFFFAIVVRNLLRANDIFHFLLCFGAMLFIVLQALINMGVVIGLLPTKGISLPFISYGGSNMVVMFVFTGIILNCMWRWTRPRKTEFLGDFNPLEATDAPEEKGAP
jgi:cell division protein FtsW